MSEVIKVSYTGRIKGGAVFDTTHEDVAKANGIAAPGMVYGPAPVILGEGTIIKGLEEALMAMNEGAETTVTVAPEKAFGQRDVKLVRLLPMKVFKDNRVSPAPGMTINLEGGLIGRVRSVSGGRVQVDFNHELAGKTLEYAVKIEARAGTDDEKAAWICEIAFPKHGAKTERKGREITATIAKDAMKLRDIGLRKKRLVDALRKHAGAETVRVVEEY